MYVTDYIMFSVLQYLLFSVHVTLFCTLRPEIYLRRNIYVTKGRELVDRQQNMFTVL